MSSVDSIKLLGVLNLTKTQREYLRTAYVLQRANGCVDARGRESAAFKMCLRRLAKITLCSERFPGVFDLTSTGFELGSFLGRRDS